MISRNVTIDLCLLTSVFFTSNAFPIRLHRIFIFKWLEALFDPVNRFHFAPSLTANISRHIFAIYVTIIHSPIPHERNVYAFRRFIDFPVFNILPLTFLIT